MHLAPQVLAAQCRHQPDNLARAEYWVELDARFLEFRAKFPRRAAEDFMSCQRRSPDAVLGREGYRPSTVMRWLREWRATIEARSLGSIREAQ